MEICKMKKLFISNIAYAGEKEQPVKEPVKQKKDILDLFEDIF